MGYTILHTMQFHTTSFSSYGHTFQLFTVQRTVMTQPALVNHKNHTKKTAHNKIIFKNEKLIKVCMVSLLIAYLEGIFLKCQLYYIKNISSLSAKNLFDGTVQTSVQNADRSYLYDYFLGLIPTDVYSVKNALVEVLE